MSTRILNIILSALTLGGLFDHISIVTKFRLVRDLITSFSKTDIHRIIRFDGLVFVVNGKTDPDDLIDKLFNEIVKNQRMVSSFVILSDPQSKSGGEFKPHASEWLEFEDDSALTTFRVCLNNFVKNIAIAFPGLLPPVLKESDSMDLQLEALLKSYIWLNSLPLDELENSNNLMELMAVNHLMTQYQSRLVSYNG